MDISLLRLKLQKLGIARNARILQGFFKTGKGEYGEGDIFLGVRVPELRKLAHGHRDIRISDVRKLLRSPIHEERLLALLILVIKYATGTTLTQKKIYGLYLRNTRYINN